MQFGSEKSFRNLSTAGKVLNWVLVAAEGIQMARKPSIPRGLLLAGLTLQAVAYHLPESGGNE